MSEGALSISLGGSVHFSAHHNSAYHDEHLDDKKLNAEGLFRPFGGSAVPSHRGYQGEENLDISIVGAFREYMTASHHTLEKGFRQWMEAQYRSRTPAAVGRCTEPRDPSQIWDTREPAHSHDELQYPQGGPEEMRHENVTF
ncbi:uncharacterized protein EI90DRAFT_3122702 [Cantharellus anzutake]|uniref:uncharacterized protein n=1 Tax=Cantharellus anzutake TaxID=1750568 RepID=UPI0019043257|nr:uncharacterized protein EI90DRAFT_3122702 [Cantharellus anzutake]KAF8332261.1 hypothetical protein EI90DRAFT_3122702 [Cantharellus anzutake]